MALQLPPLAGARRRTPAASPVHDEAPPPRTAGRVKQAIALFLFLAITAVAVAQYSGLIPIAWLAVGPLLASLVLTVRITAVLAGWSMLLGLGLTMGAARPPGGSASHLGDMVVLASRYVSAAAEARVGGDLAWHEPGGYLIPAGVPGTLKSMCLKCGKHIIKSARSRDARWPDRSSWMTNDSDGDAFCHAPPSFPQGSDHD